MDNQQIIELFQSRGMIDQSLGQDLLNEVDHSGKEIAEAFASTRITNEECTPSGLHWAYDSYALAASTAHALAGRIDFVLGAAVAVALVVGAWLGRRLARGTDVRALQAATASVLLATGAWFLFA